MANKEGMLVSIGGAVVVAVATWFAFLKPAPLPAIGTDATGTPGMYSSSSAASIGGAGTDISLSANGENGGGVGAGGGAAPAKIVIAFTAPTSSSALVIGQSYDIAWNKPAGIGGQLYLASATSGAAIGWVEQNIGPAQTMFPWNARGVFLSSSSPASKDIVPGTYVLKLKFDSPQIPLATSAPFTIVASSTATSSAR